MEAGRETQVYHEVHKERKKDIAGRGLRPDLGDSLRSSPRTDSASVKPGLTPKRGATLRRINTQRGNSPHPKSNSHIFSTINLVLARIKGDVYSIVIRTSLPQQGYRNTFFARWRQSQIRGRFQGALADDRSVEFAKQ